MNGREQECREKLCSRAEELAWRHGVQELVKPVRANLDKKEGWDRAMTALSGASIVAMIRFLHRPLLRFLASEATPGQGVVVSHFAPGVDKAFGRPRNRRDVLATGELEELFTPTSGWSVLRNCDDATDDGRPLKTFAALRC